MPSRRSTFMRPRAAAHLTLPDPMTRATPLGVTAAVDTFGLPRSRREAGRGRVHVRKDLEDLREAREVEDAEDVRLDACEAKVASPLARLLHRLQEGPQAGAAHVIDTREVGDEMRAAVLRVGAQRRCKRVFPAGS